MIENDLRTWLSELLGVHIHYQHLDRRPGNEFCWFIRSGDQILDTMDETGDADVVFFDVEIYAVTATRVQTLAQLLRSSSGFRGQLASGAGRVEDIAVEDQQDDYTPQASADSLPDYAAQFRLQVSIYEPPED